MRKECEDYLKNYFLNGPKPADAVHTPTEEEWNRIPQTHKEWMIDMIIGFNSKNEMMDKIMIAFNKKMPDISFGMEVKSIIRKK